MPAKYIFDHQKLTRDGVLHLPAFIKGPELLALQEEVMALVEDDSKMVPREGSEHFFQKYQSTSYCFVNQFEQHPQLKALESHPLLCSLRQSILGEDNQLLLSLVQHNKAGEGQVIPWHQDVHFEQVAPGCVFNFLLYPFDATEESGALHFVRGSHTHGRLPKGQPHDDLPGQEFIVPKAGDLIIGDCLLFHRVNPNCSEQDRISINLRCRSKQVSEADTQIGVYRNGQVNYAG